MSARVPITFLPAGVTVWVASGTTVHNAAKMADVVIPAPCGGRGVCGSCGVRVVSGELAPADEQELAGLHHAPSGIRLACRARVIGACEVRPILSQPRVALSDAGADSRPLVAGVDLGTTSVAALLVDLLTGREIARAAVPNRQQAFGADVLTRLSAALEGSAESLQSAAEESIVSALGTAAAQGGVQTAGIERLVIAGNSAMMGLLMGADVSSLATAPFTPASFGGELAEDSAVRRALAPGASAILLPPIGAFVGGDALAAAIAAGMTDAQSPMLLVDFGTNAEIILAGCGPLIVASAAAGPAFEGAGISCGGPAAEGAVTRVAVGDDGSVELTAIGSQPPRWFSGSGIVSAVAELLRAGHLGADGRLTAEGSLAERFSVADGVIRVSLGSPDECLSVSQLDVRELQLGKAAVRTGIVAVLRSAGIGGGDLTALLVAGAFGSALDPGDLVDLGVVPAEAAGVLRTVGNAALEGATVMALDPGIIELAKALAVDAVHLDLAGDPGFGQELMAATELAPFTAGA